MEKIRKSGAVEKVRAGVNLESGEGLQFFWLGRKKRDSPVYARGLASLGTVPFLLGFVGRTFSTASQPPDSS